MLELVALVADDLRAFAADHASTRRRPSTASTATRGSRTTRRRTRRTSPRCSRGPGLGKNTCAGFYFSVSHETVEIAGGMYMPGPPELAAVRKAIARRTGETFRKLLAAPDVKKHAGRVARGRR